MLMACFPRRSRGVTLIEIVITLVIASILVVMAVPNFTEWIRNQRIRTAAESILNGLQTARAEALTTNSPVNFQVSGSDSGSWAVVTSRGGNTVQSGQWSRAQVSLGVPSLCFNGMGRVCASGSGSVDISSDDDSACLGAPGGKARCLRITVNNGGGIRLCDPDPALPTTNTRGC